MAADQQVGSQTAHRRLFSTGYAWGQIGHLVGQRILEGFIHGMAGGRISKGDVTIQPPSPLPDLRSFHDQFIAAIMPVSQN
jgi:hypothetical protein